MDKPTILEPFQAGPDIDVVPAYFPIPSMGFLAVNAFVIKAKEPVLVDTGMGIESEEFMKALASIIDPQDLRWVWLTHDDADHTGNIQKVLEAAPSARLAANSLAVLRMSTAWPVPMHRVYWLNSGESINVGDRQLTAVRPPLSDNPTWFRAASNYHYPVEIPGGNSTTGLSGWTNSFTRLNASKAKAIMARPYGDVSSTFNL